MSDLWMSGPCASHAVFVIVLVSIMGMAVGAVKAENAVAPRSVKVLPVFFVPKGETEPTTDQMTRMMAHLEWSRTRYQELLGDTFEIAEPKPRVYHSEEPLDFYRAQPEGAAPQFVSELLKAYGYNRYTCPYIILVMFMNSVDGFPGGGGRPINGGLNTGGGIIIFSSYDYDRAPNVQSSIQHELGHAFGLPHVDVYGLDMGTNMSFMSYNPEHHTNGFTPSATPGVVIPEDVRALAMNHRVFHKLRFDPKKDIPAGYKIAERIVGLGPMILPGQPDGATVTTDAGEEGDSKAAYIVQGQILTAKDAFDPSVMWQSAKVSKGWAAADVALPYDVDLTMLRVYSGCADRDGAARAVRVSVKDAEGQWRQLREEKIKASEGSITFAKTHGSEWKIEFEPGDSGYVIVRGVRFFVGKDELFPPLVVYGEDR